MGKSSLIALVAIATVASGCAAALAGTSRPSASARQVARGLAFATSHCSACHAVTPGGISPDPEAPPWEAVVNVPGLTLATLRTFLRDSHNYPMAMNFTVERTQINDLAVYMMTLKQRDYRPPVQ